MYKQRGYRFGIRTLSQKCPFRFEQMSHSLSFQPFHEKDAIEESLPLTGELELKIPFGEEDSLL